MPRWLLTLLLVPLGACPQALPGDSGSAEVCNGQDDDGDGAVDEDPVDGQDAYLDGDGDGSGGATSLGWVCDLPPEGSWTRDDCDDADPATWPGAPEVCDGRDNDCDGVGDTPIPCYVDGDGDGWGDLAADPSCTCPSGTVATPGDCDDGDATVHPAADEVCDGRDQDCDGGVDDGLGEGTVYEDRDGDGHGDGASPVPDCGPRPGVSTTGDDCDDTNPRVHPQALDYRDTVDGNCAGDADTHGLRDARAALTGTPDSSMGYAVAGAGDTDGDGILELLAGGPMADVDGGTDNGGVVLVPATVTGTVSAAAVGLVLTGGDGSRLGSALAGGADGDGDGLDDLLLGAVGAEAVALLRGPVTAAGALESPAAWILGADPDGWTGYSVTWLTDQDGDGRGDLAVSAPNAGRGNGQVGVFSGGLEGSVSLDGGMAVLDGTGSGLAGYALADGGDTDGDGRGDLVVGAPCAGKGEIWIVPGPLEGVLAPGPRLVHEGPDEMMAVSVANLGDTDGDGYDDLALGAPNDGAMDARGRVYVFRNPLPEGSIPLTDADALFEAEDRDGAWGPSKVTGPLDVDGDGRGDLLAGSPNWSDAPVNSGAAFLWRGPLEGVHSTADAHVQLPGYGEYAQAGCAVASPGDVDRDGYGDMLVGARCFGDDEMGAAFLVLGGPPP